MSALAEKGGSDRGEDFEAAALFLHFDNALIWGQRREHFSWRHTDVPNHTVYFNLNNDQHEIVRPDHPGR